MRGNSTGELRITADRLGAGVCVFVTFHCGCAAVPSIPAESAADLLAVRWGGLEEALPESGCDIEKRAGWCDGQPGADPIGSAGQTQAIRVTQTPEQWVYDISSSCTNTQQIFFTQDTKNLQQRGFVFLKKNHAQEKTRRRRRFQNKHDFVFIPKLQAMKYESGPPET